MLNIQSLNQHFHLSLGKGLVLALFVSIAGILLAASPMGRWLEEDIGLSWLFQLRGPLPSPEQVVVVSIDLVSSQKLGLANNPLKWPRSLQGDLLRKLHAHGAVVSSFDIFFEETRDAQDNQLFAQALRDTNRSILFQSLNKQPVFKLNENATTQQSAIIESLSQPIDILRDASFGLAPFPLPKVPAKVNHFNLFLPALGDIPTLPVATLQVYTLPVYQQLFDLLYQLIPEQIQQLSEQQLPRQQHTLAQLDGIQQLSQTLRQLFLKNPGLPQQLRQQLETSTLQNTQQYVKLLALINCFDLPDSQYLNFYGPPHTITTIPFYRVLESSEQGDPLGLAGKAVFIGFSEQFQPQQRDGFYTVFSQPQSGLDLSGVEIAASSFANLLQGRTLSASKPGIDILLYVFWALLLGLLLRSLSALLMFPTALFLALAYHHLAYELFTQANYWIPLSIPLLWQTPLALIAALLWNYFDVQKERANIRHAFGHHLPIKIVDQLAKGREHFASTGEQTRGTVLATDAMQYTKLSEQLHPAQLRELMNRYYETLFTPICIAGGVISDVVGDAALATWTSSSTTDYRQRSQACRAALQILTGVEQFNRDNPTYQLPTRLGLHYGELVMGHVGAVDHYEYRAVGDTVNTATRIEGLNKQLGTHILVSSEVLQGVDDFITRELGHFLLLGKSKALCLHELIATKTQPIEYKPYAEFSSALHAFQAQQWQESSNLFQQFIHQYGEDGPSQFYLKLCQEHLNHPPKSWDGVIHIISK